MTRAYKKGTSPEDQAVHPIQQPPPTVSVAPFDPGQDVGKHTLKSTISEQECHSACRSNKLSGEWDNITTEQSRLSFSTNLVKPVKPRTATCTVREMTRIQHCCQTSNPNTVGEILRHDPLVAQLHKTQGESVVGSFVLSAKRIDRPDDADISLTRGVTVFGLPFNRL